MTQTAEGGAAPRPHGAVGSHGSHVAVAHRTVDDGLTIEGILHLAGKHLVRAVLRVALAQLVAVALAECPQTAALGDDGSGYTQQEEERVLLAPAVTKVQPSSSISFTRRGSDSSFWEPRPSWPN